ncbi:MAG: hypothetical protein J0M07_28665 [Anaerolineae bacterium]|nr:hypothetical protein [Anaerolineae bacterium]
MTNDALYTAADMADAQAKAFERGVDSVRAGEGLGGWRPIKSAPRDGTHIIAWRGTAHPPHAESMYWCGFDGAEHGKCDGAWHWVQDGDAPKAGPTHWMPLPPAPHASA